MKKRKWKKEELIDSVKNSTSYRQVIAKLGMVPAGGNYSQVKKYISELELSISHFKGRGWSKGMTGIGKPIISIEKILTQNSSFQSYKLKNRLFKEGLKTQECEKCGWKKVSIDGRLPLELDHINGDSSDNRIENLQILCPNCHSLQPTHRGLNKRKKA